MALYTSLCSDALAESDNLCPSSFSNPLYSA